MNRSSENTKLEELLEVIVLGSFANTVLAEEVVRCGAASAANWIADVFANALPTDRNEAKAWMEAVIAVEFARLKSELDSPISREYFRAGFLAMLTAYPTCGFVLVKEGA